MGNEDAGVKAPFGKKHRMMSSTFKAHLLVSCAAMTIAGPASAGKASAQTASPPASGQTQVGDKFTDAYVDAADRVSDYRHTGREILLGVRWTY